MDRLGAGIRFTARVDRRLCIEGTRFALRTLPVLRGIPWIGVVAIVVCIAMAVSSVDQAAADGQAGSAALAGAAPMLIVLVFVIGSSSPWVRARLLARKAMLDMPPEFDVSYRFDEDGYAIQAPGRSTRYEWPAMTVVAEGDRFLAVQVGRRHFMAVPAVPLTDTERGAIRRWAESAPGGPRWEVRRSGREQSRLHVSPSPPPAAGEPPIATAD